MKTINVPLEDSQYKQLVRVKTKLKLNWRQFFMRLLRDGRY